jgi:hypothetical protein
VTGLTSATVLTGVALVVREEINIFSVALLISVTE